MIKDLTDIFTKGILNSANYNPKTIQGKLENLPNIRCVFYDDSPFDNWYLITRDDEKGVAEYYGFLSYRFPVALLMENCPDNLRIFLKGNNIFTDKFYRRCSCEEDILRKYTPKANLSIIDDRKLLDGRISFDSQEFITICSFHYLSPYDFDFSDII
ncbi:MAG: hypothetical protein K2I80_09760 [Ruminococcus sp.]|nr:hypothetical protein [Ruminococcus sp.]